MPYRKTVVVSRQDNGEGVPATWFHDPRDRRRPYLWFGPDVPEWVKPGDSVVIEKTGERRPQWRIVERAAAW